MTDRRLYDRQFKKNLLTTGAIPKSTNCPQNGDSDGTFRVLDKMRSQRIFSSQDPYYFAPHSIEQAGGDARVSTLKKKPSSGNDEQQSEASCQQTHHYHKHQQENCEKRHQPCAAVYISDASSSRTNSTKETRIEKGHKNNELERLTQSKINLAQTINEGIRKNSKSRRSCTKVIPSSQGYHNVSHSASDNLNCCSSPPAELINEKIIQPMCKKFRLLYLENIKKEVAIMEELEVLPDKMDKIRRDPKIRE